MPPLSFNPFQSLKWPPAQSSFKPETQRPADPARKQIGAIDSFPPPPPPSNGAYPPRAQGAPEKNGVTDRVYTEILTQQTTADFWIQQMGLNPF